MRDIHKMCRVCLSEGSRQIFEQSLASTLLQARDDLSRIAEKLRFVTMLKVCTIKVQKKILKFRCRKVFGREKFATCGTFYQFFFLFFTAIQFSMTTQNKHRHKQRTAKHQLYNFLLLCFARTTTNRCNKEKSTRSRKKIAFVDRI